MVIQSLRPVTRCLTRGSCLLLAVLIAACNFAFVGCSGQVSGNSPNTPAAVQHTATLTWVASTSTVSGYNVYRGTQSGGPYTQLNSSVVVGLSYTDSTVQVGLTYFFVVTSVDTAGGESDFSNEVSVTIPSP